MTLNRLKFKDKSIEDLFSDYIYVYNNPVTYFGQNDKEKQEIIDEVKARIHEKSEKIIRLNMEHDRFRSRRQGEIR